MMENRIKLGFWLCIICAISACNSGIQPQNKIIASSDSVQFGAFLASADSAPVASCCTQADGGRCTGSAYCTACKNCSGCAHCNSGGSCGVCAGGKSRTYSPGTGTSHSSSTPKTTQPSQPNYQYHSTPNTEIASGKVSFWTDIQTGGEIEVYVDQKYAGTIDAYFSVYDPKCGQAGTVTVTRPVGIHSYSAKSTKGLIWNGEFYVKTGCKSLKLGN